MRATLTGIETRRPKGGLAAAPLAGLIGERLEMAPVPPCEPTLLGGSGTLFLSTAIGPSFLGPRPTALGPDAFGAAGAVAGGLGGVGVGGVAAGGVGVGGAVALAAAEAFGFTPGTGWVTERPPMAAAAAASAASRADVFGAAPLMMFSVSIRKRSLRLMH